jgi:hypothetical protein
MEFIKMMYYLLVATCLLSIDMTIASQDRLLKQPSFVHNSTFLDKQKIVFNMNNYHALQHLFFKAQQASNAYKIGIGYQVLQDWMGIEIGYAHNKSKVMLTDLECKIIQMVGYLLESVHYLDELEKNKRLIHINDYCRSRDSENNYIIDRLNEMVQCQQSKSTSMIKSCVNKVLLDQIHTIIGQAIYSKRPRDKSLDDLIFLVTECFEELNTLISS